MLSKTDSQTIVDFINELSGTVKFNQHKKILVDFITEMTQSSEKTIAGSAFDKSDENCFHTIRKTPHELDNTETRKSEKKKGFKVRTQGESERGQKYSPKVGE